MRNRWQKRISPRICCLWRGGWKGGTVEPSRILFDHELVVVSQGRCRVQIEREEFELRAGSYLVVPPGKLHSTVTSSGGVFRHCIHFDWLPLPPRQRRLPLWSSPLHRPRRADLRPAPSWMPRKILAGRFDPQGPVLSLLETAFTRWQSGTEFDRATCHGPLAEILLHLLWSGSRHAGRLDRATQLADRVKEKIDDASLGDASIEELLVSLGFSYAHLCRLFTARFGMSPVRYRNAVRLERARHLLLDPGMTVAEAAYAAGFGDPAYFTRKFSEQHGIPPSRWR